MLDTVEAFNIRSARCEYRQRQEVQHCRFKYGHDGTFAPCHKLLYHKRVNEIRASIYYTVALFIVETQNPTVFYTITSYT